MSNLSTQHAPDGWYTMYVRHQNEFKIARILEEKLGIESLVPSMRVWRKHKGKKRFFERPLLHTYVFIKANLCSIDWRLYHSINGILGLVRQAGQPVLAPEEQVSSLVKLGRSSNPIHEIEYRRFKPNDHVEVIDGPLKGAVGFFIRTNEHTGQFVVSVDMFNRTLVTELEPHFVRP